MPTITTITVEKIEEGKMIGRLVKNFFTYALKYGVVHIASLVIVFILGFFIGKIDIFGAIIMTCIVVFCNVVFVDALSKSAMDKSFEGVSPVKATAKSRRKILTATAIVVAIIILIMNLVNLIILHSTFAERISSEIYYIDDVENSTEAELRAISQYGIFSSANKLSDTRYSVIAKKYPFDAVITFSVVGGVNVIILLFAITYEKKFIDKYLVVD